MNLICFFLSALPTVFSLAIQRGYSSKPGLCPVSVNTLCGHDDFEKEGCGGDPDCPASQKCCMVDCVIKCYDALYPVPVPRLLTEGICAYHTSGSFLKCCDELKKGYNARVTGEDPNKWMPRCTEDGYYLRRQQGDVHQWCVNREGFGFRGYSGYERVKDALLNDTKFSCYPEMPGKLADCGWFMERPCCRGSSYVYMKLILEDENLTEYQPYFPDCDQNWDYAPVQVDPKTNRHICVDKFGNKLKNVGHWNKTAEEYQCPPRKPETP